MKNSPGRPITRMILSFILALLPTIGMAQDEVKVLKHEWGKAVENLNAVATLPKVSSNTYKGYVTLQQYESVVFSCGDYGYQGSQQYVYENGEISKVTDGVLELVQISLDTQTWGYFNTTVTETFYMVAELSDDKTKMNVKVIRSEDVADPTPLSMAINGTTIAVSDDINGLSETFSIEGSYEVTEGNSLTIGGISAGGAVYGAQTQPAFTGSKDEQTQTVALVSGAGDISITQPGIYTVRLSVQKGVPSACIITKASGDKIPLKINIGGNSPIVADDVEGQTGAFNVQGTYNVDAGGSLSFGPVTVGDTSYGFDADPTFDATNNAQQTLKLRLVAGGNAATISVKGTYSLTIALRDGEPTGCTVTRAPYTPELTLDGASVTPDASGIYTKTAFYSAGAVPVIVYEGTRLYLTADILATDAEAHTMALSTSDSGHKVAAAGSYDLRINPSALSLSYTCTSYRDPSLPDEGFSSTFPQEMLEWTGNGYTPANQANTIFYEETSPGWSMQCSPRYDMHTFLIGNGSIGLTLSGNRFDEMKLCHKTFYEGAPPSAYPTTTTGTGHIDAPGQYEELGKLFIRDINESGDLKYLSQLDMSKGVVSAYALRDKPVAAEYFVSNPDDVFVANLTSEQPRNYEIALGGRLSGKCTDGSHFIASASLKTVSNTVCIAWDTDGVADTSGTTVKINNATRLMVVIACASSYDQTAEDFRSGKDLTAEAIGKTDVAIAKGFRSLYADHVADHSTLYDACALEFDNTAENDMSIDRLVDGGRKGTLTDAQWRLLETIIFNYGRYTLIGSSRKDNVLPNFLEGIWGTDDQWNRDIHADVNVEMNYWPAESTGLGDPHMAFLNYIINMSQRPEWRKLAAARAPGCDSRAWTLGNANNIFGHQVEFNSQYSEANAWFCHHLWQHYVYTLDNEYLARIVPVMENACRFWEKRLISNGSGKLVLPECWSPENGGGGGTTAVHGRQLVTDLFTNAIAGRKILGGDTGYLSTMQNILSRLDNGIHVNGGAIEEWEGTAPIADGHRHLSHLMCLFPLGQVSPFDADPTAFDATIRSLELRGDGDGGEAAGWVDAWRANCRARTRQPNTSNGYKGAYENLRTAVAEEHLMLNLNNTTLGQYQIEGNAGLTSAIAEMLLQSYRGSVTAEGVSGVIDLLPALPQEWTAGSIKGIRAKGGYTTDMTWSDSRVQRATINVSHNGKLQVHHPNISSMYIYLNGKTYTAPQHAAAYAAASVANDDYVAFPSLKAGDKIVISAKRLSTGIDDIEGDAVEESDCEAPIEYFNLQGIRVAHPEAGGLYIRRQGNRVEKIRM